MKVRVSCAFAVVLCCIFAFAGCDSVSAKGVDESPTKMTDKSVDGSYLFSDERLENSGYRFELSYQLIGEGTKYLYMNPKESVFNTNDYGRAI